MKPPSLSRLQKICILGFIAALLLFIAGGISLFLESRPEEEPSPEGEPAGIQETEDSQALADEMLYYPDKILLNQPMPELTFYDISGNQAKLSDYRGKNVILLFWTSWCPYCSQEFEHLKEYEQLLAEYGDMELLLLNKLDGEKETREQAEEFLDRNQVGFTNYYDEDLTIYHLLGIKVIPTFLGINRDGILKICYPDNIKSKEQLRAMIEYIRNGGAYATERFLTGRMTNAEGGVYVNYYASEAEPPSGHDVLSESQGIMMEYAVRTGKKELFDRYLHYVTENMLNKDALAGWVLTDALARPKLAKVNSLVDDLRICGALQQAQQLWGGYDAPLAQWEDAVIKYNTKDRQLIDHYDFQSKEKAERLTLCYADFSAVKNFQNADMAEIYDNALQIVINGYISDNIPLYYSWYDYKKQKYSADDLNMAEELVTLLHLAQAGELKQETIGWLKKAMENGGIMARYTVHGEVTEGYHYESTAVYALAVMIAEEIDDKELMTKALARMERMRVNDTASEFDGSFGSGDGQDIYSYDQCMALLAYASME